MRLGRNTGDRADLCVAILLTGMLVFFSAFLATPAFAQDTTGGTTRESTDGNNTGGNNRNGNDGDGRSNRQVCEQVVNLLLDLDVDQTISGDVTNNISGDGSNGGSIVGIIADLLDISVNQVQECIQESDEDVIDDPGGTLPFTGGSTPTFLKGDLVDGPALLAIAASCIGLALLGHWVRDRLGW